MTSGESKKSNVVGEIEPFDPTHSLNVAADALEVLKAPYALIGGLALDAWGIPRATKDADIAVPLGVAEKTSAAIEIAGSEHRPLRIGGVGIRASSPDVRLDLIDRRFEFHELYRELIEETQVSGRVTKVGAREIPLVSLEHLLATKLVSGQDKDDIDVKRILGLERLDYRAARAIVLRHLGPATANRLDEWARAIGRPEVRGRALSKNGDPVGES
ncbi:MAG: hypothetical protein HY791_11355 [Deltaproteobacteria bacterium]|nr:hypothetical protein [Deltaproteobacteria bacterium]